MKISLILFLSLFQYSLHALTIESQIDSIDEGNDAEAHLIKLSTGEVVFLDKSPHRDSILKDLYKKLAFRELVKFRLTSNRSVESFDTVSSVSWEPSESVLNSTIEENYIPTRISLTEAQRVFSQMRRDWQNESQCYNRAHIWAYEEFLNSSVNSMKLFIFFTSRYIRNYRFKWWFHVTPMVELTDGTWRTLDRRYTTTPLKIQNWSNVFMANNAVCPMIQKYSTYRLNQKTEDCYLIPVSMYFWQPRDIEKFESSGVYKQRFITSEIDHAYWEAF